MMRKLTYGALLTIPVLVGCGTASDPAVIDCVSQPALCQAPTPTPTPTPTQVTRNEPEFETRYSLDLYAKVTSSNPDTSSDLRFRPLNVVDGYITSRANNNNGAFTIWSPARCDASNKNQINASKLIFTWATPVDVNRVDLYNASVVDNYNDSDDEDTIQLVKAGKLRFYDESSGGSLIKEIPFTALNEDGSAKKIDVSLGTEKALRMEILITDSQGNCAGLSEVGVIGARDATIATTQSDLAPFMRIQTPSGVKATSGLTSYHPLNIKDRSGSGSALGDTRWLTPGNGANADITFTFDKEVCIQQMRFADGTLGSAAIKKGSVSINGGDEEMITFSGTGTLSKRFDGVKSIHFRVKQFDDAGSGNFDAGLSNVNLTPCSN